MAKNSVEIPTENADEMPAVVDELQDLIDAAGGPSVAGLVVRVYRKQIAPNGKKKFLFCGKYDCLIDEQDVGEDFGAGDYLIHFRWRKDGKKTETTRNWSIGDEFTKPGIDKAEEGPAEALAGTPNAPAVIPPQGNAGGLLGGLLGNITAEKVTAGLALLDAVKKFLAPPPPPDYTKLFELMLSNQRGQTVGDAVVIEALKQANKPAAPVPTVMDQINNLKAVRDAFRNDFADNNNDQGGDKMDYFIEKALTIIPDLLKKHNNDYFAVGKEAAENKFVRGLITSDPELTQKFFQAAVDNCGATAAQELAKGFGVPLTFNQEQPAAESEPAAANSEV